MASRNTVTSWYGGISPPDYPEEHEMADSKPGVRAVQAQHRFAGVSDRALCACGWQSPHRVGSVAVARERHRQHRDEVVAAWRAEQ